MELGACYQPIVLSVGIVWIHAKRILYPVMYRHLRSPSCRPSGEAKAPVHCWPTPRTRRGFRHFDRNRHTNKPGANMAATPTVVNPVEPQFQLLVLGLRTPPVCPSGSGADHGKP